MAHILVVEDEPIIRSALKRLLERQGHSVSEAGSVDDALKDQQPDQCDLVISDLRLPGAPGTDLIRATDTPVLIMTSYASLRSAVDSMKMGAVDYIAKPFDHDEMVQTVARILENRQKPAAPKHSGKPLPGMIGNCPQMQVLYHHIHKVAPTDATVLILGETGTGKELVARAIHAESRRADKPLISVNCAAIPETLIESELFGYEKGAFTGANASRMGLIEAANGGTLFLDEIGELPIEAQARLLRFIQEGEIRRIGSVQSHRVDVRLLAATHRDLRTLSQKGEFREDLYYRINVMPLLLPPLRERGRDVLAIAETLLAHFCEKLGKPARQFAPDAIQAITTYTWPGNVREMENAVERAVILSESDEISNDLLAIDLDLVEITEDEDDRQITDNRPKANQPDPSEGLSLEDYFTRFVLDNQDSMTETELAAKLGITR
ncbi:MAG: sigma-54-dependent Fis family transcriptional regulator, partial [Gammaproteobacteria bacterium]